MQFVKMHGLGNDFVVVDATSRPAPADPAALARRICDRALGIGADGLILVLAPERGVEADIQMRIWNRDGAEAEMCGNGIRCVCKLAHERGLSRRTPMRIQTARGVLALTYEVSPTGSVDSVTVGMGEPILEAARVPVAVAGLARVIDAPIASWFAGTDAWQDECGLDPRVTCVSMGNPHAILYCKDVARVPLERVGPFLETHASFPNRTNVHFVEVRSRGEVVMRTWERGAGMTLACGTGASAVCVAGVLTGRTDRQLLAHLPGGDLDLVWRETDGQVLMTGPAAFVLSGEWPE